MLGAILIVDLVAMSLNLPLIHTELHEYIYPCQTKKVNVSNHYLLAHLSV